MKILNGNHYVELKDKRYVVHPNENDILRKRDPLHPIETNIKFKILIRLGKIKKLWQKLEG